MYLYHTINIDCEINIYLGAVYVYSGNEFTDKRCVNIHILTKNTIITYNNIDSVKCIFENIMESTIKRLMCLDEIVEKFIECTYNIYGHADNEYEGDEKFGSVIVTAYTKKNLIIYIKLTDPLKILTKMLKLKLKNQLIHLCMKVVMKHYRYWD